MGPFLLFSYGFSFFYDSLVYLTSLKEDLKAMNLNGDYISEALAACVGGIGIAPGANLSDNYAVRVAQ